MDIREKLIEAVGREIIGPAPHAAYTDEDGEELILSRVHGTPKSRYGVAMLYPQMTINEGEVDDNDSATTDRVFDEDNEEIKGSRVTDITGSEDDEEPVSLANQFLPSAMGFTLRFKKTPNQNTIIIKTSAAAYEKEKGYRPVLKVAPEHAGQIPATKASGEVIESEYWRRKSFTIDPITIDLDTASNEKIFKEVTLIYADKEDWLKLKIFNRTSPTDEGGGFLTLTFILVNCIKSVPDGTRNDKYVLYQTKLRLETEHQGLIAPYSERVAATDTIEENQLKLLYRKKRVFAIGHGTAVNWKIGNFGVQSVETSAIPVFEMPQVAPAGNVVLSMYELSTEGNWGNAACMLKNLLSEYEKWIAGIEKEKEKLESQYQSAAAVSITKCRECYDRINKGIEILLAADESSDLVRCFRWMNSAMLWQQQRSKTKQRLWKRNGAGRTFTYELEEIGGGQGKDFQSLKEFHDASPYNGKWRPFQLAFILLNIHSLADPNSDERRIVDLIWFPTGGGKTEAYLGLSAFTIFMRRIKGFKDFDESPYTGTAILMRYTLRLLTTQQYERAASLICACDLIRKANVELGGDPISIGLWVGGSSTPNTHNSAEGNAVYQYNQLLQKDNAPYNFIVMKCPCCGAQIGRVDKRTIKGLSKNDGVGGHVVFKCENKYCEYGGLELPLFVVDEYIYLKHPTLILGTVDKFAMIPWKKEAGSIFGFREHEGAWTRIQPPELIIQDELHLISGPLGTMVGLYEVMVQNLCINYGVRQSPFLPDDRSGGFGAKVIASSATISRAAEQVKSLYGTDRLSIFPPQGLEFGNTWFSEEKEISEQFPARTYVGILGSGYPSIQASIIRSYAAVLQKVKELSDQEQIDYYWTLLGYFNSIRELGNASSLVYADVRERLSQLQNRELVPFNLRRKLFKSEELTSRISAFEIPEALKKLEKSFSNSHNQAIDICLATNMVATGVDISRLGLMFVHGQPKTTAEYIQASSRVGRDVPKGPGLIFTIYSPSKPRDKSLYENFQGYHMRIYAHVEPTSVTPYSINARQKGLHAVFIGLMRHLAEGNLRTNASTQGTDFQNLSLKVKELILERCAISDPHELINTEKQIDDIIHFWKDRFQNYGDAGNFAILSNEDYVPLMYASSAEVRDEIRKASLSTPTSMRGVDSESRIVIVDQKN